MGLTFAKNDLPSQSRDREAHKESWSYIRADSNTATVSKVVHSVWSSVRIIKQIFHFYEYLLLVTATKVYVANVMKQEHNAEGNECQVI